MPKRMTQRKLLTTEQLAKETAGGDNYIRTKGNEVKGIALRLDLNPDAPNIIPVGKSTENLRRARLLLNSGLSAPTYVKRDTNSWEYVGDYRAYDLRSDKQTIETYGNSREKGSVAAILFLEESQTPVVAVRGGGFGTPEIRRKVESAAIRYVTDELERQGFQVEDRQRENCGYDLLASSRRTVLKVEVKGTDGSTPRFFLTRNEWSTSGAVREWRLAIVCNALSSPHLRMLTRSELIAEYECDALAWECRPKTV